MNESQAKLETEIGTKEPEKQVLKPAKVKIVNVEVIPVEKAKGEKAVFEVKHPDKEETIKISAASYLEGREVVTFGTWYSLDKEGKLQKGTALTVLLNKISAKSLKDAIGKEVDTEMNGKYLAFKAY
jgi:hypothetical protein